MASTLVAILALLTSAADGLSVLQPTAKWRVDFAEQRCVAVHSYLGVGGAAVTLALKPSVTGATLQVTLAEAGGPIGAEQNDIAVRMDGAAGETVVRTTLLRYADKQKRLRYASFSLPSDRFAALGAASTMSLNGIGYRNAIALPQIGNVLALLEGCTEDLRRLWHIDKSGADDIAQEARSIESMNNVFRDDDYPEIAIAKLQVGRLEMLVLIDEKGRVQDCNVEKSSGVAVLDATGCTSMELRARYAPALDRNGNPVKSSAAVNLEFRMGGPGGVDWLSQ